MNKKRIIVKVDPELYKELKIASIKSDQTSTSFVVEAIKDRINNLCSYKMVNSRIQLSK